jgi:hypothetical protein
MDLKTEGRTYAGHGLRVYFTFSALHVIIITAIFLKKIGSGRHNDQKLGQKGRC